MSKLHAAPPIAEAGQNSRPPRLLGGRNFHDKRARERKRSIRLTVPAREHGAVFGLSLAALLFDSCGHIEPCSNLVSLWP